MRIDINQKKITVGSQYKIFLNKKESYYAETQLLSFLPVLNLYPHDSFILRMRMSKLFSWFKPKYKIYFPNEDKIVFKSESLFKDVYSCTHQSDNYKIYGHKGRNFSIFKNEEQIASWKKEAISWFAGDNYTIWVNNDAYHELIISFCLIIDSIERKKNKGNILSYDFGNFIEARKTNPNWRPE